jgi:hypothetical protein
MTEPIRYAAAWGVVYAIVVAVVILL